MASVLDGVRVLDLGRFIAGPYCAALLADFGADVVRVDRVGGSEDRYVTPVTEAGEGAFFLQVNRNKRSVSLDIETSGGQEVLRRLVQWADVVIANMPDSTLRKLGLDYESLSTIKPDIILLAASAFGSTGENRDRVGFDGVAQAMSGAVYLSGPSGHPSKAMVPVVDFSTAFASAMGVMAALYERRTSGRGQRVETSLMLTALTHASGTLIEEDALRLGRRATGNRSPIAAPSDIFAATDGWIIVQVIGQPLFKRWANLIGRPDLLDDERFATDLSRGSHGELISGLMAEWCATRTCQELLRALEQARIPAGPVYSPRQALDDATLAGSGYFQVMEYPGLPEPVRVVSPPCTLSETPATVRMRAPQAGEHTDEVLAEVGYNVTTIAALRQQGIV